MSWTVGDPPPVLRTARLVLDQPTLEDVEAIVESCQDATLRRFVPVLVPYEREHAIAFVDGTVARGWSTGEECTWAMREHERGPLVGVIGWRLARGDVGYWLGAAARGRGLMAEAVRAVDAWLFAERGVQTIGWLATAGNVASAATARAAGFRYTGDGDLPAPGRDGVVERAWFAELHRDDDPLVRHEWPVL